MTSISTLPAAIARVDISDLLEASARVEADLASEEEAIDRGRERLAEIVRERADLKTQARTEQMASALRTGADTSSLARDREKLDQERVSIEAAMNTIRARTETLRTEKSYIKSEIARRFGEASASAGEELASEIEQAIERLMELFANANILREGLGCRTIDDARIHLSTVAEKAILGWPRWKQNRISARQPISEAINARQADLLAGGLRTKTDWLVNL